MSEYTDELDDKDLEGLKAEYLKNRALKEKSLYDKYSFELPLQRPGSPSGKGFSKVLRERTRDPEQYP